jgi:Tol biopolymer transport system component
LLRGLHRFAPATFAAWLALSALLAPEAARAAPSGVNRKIVFVRVLAGETQHIFSISSSGTGLKQLTSGNTLDFAPSLSPNGKLIAFSRLGTNSNLDVFTVHPDGRGLRQLTHSAHGEANGLPAWSPDGGSIAFTRGPFMGGSPGQIYRMRADGTHLVQLTHSAVDSSMPAWSKGLIAYVQGEAPDSAIWTMRPDGHGNRRLTGAKSGAEHPVFSPDGTLIAFDRQLGHGASAIYLMARNGKHQRRITGTRGIHEDPAFSPDGSLIVFAASSRSSNVALFTIAVQLLLAEAEPDPAPLAEGRWLLELRKAEQISVEAARGGL